MIRVELAWPAKELSPNARVHFMALHRFKKAAREEGNWATRIAIGHAKFLHDGTSDIILRQIAHPPDRRERDRDGIDSRLKATVMERTDESIGKYILGHTEMGIVTFALALKAWPELATKLEALS